MAVEAVCVNATEQTAGGEQSWPATNSSHVGDEAKPRPLLSTVWPSRHTTGCMPSTHAHLSGVTPSAGDACVRTRSWSAALRLAVVRGQWGAWARSESLTSVRSGPGRPSCGTHEHFYHQQGLVQGSTRLEAIDTPSGIRLTARCRLLPTESLGRSVGSSRSVALGLATERGSSGLLGAATCHPSASKADDRVKTAETVLSCSAWGGLLTTVGETVKL